MRYWICTNCGLIHSEKVAKCECGMHVFLAQNWVEFSSEQALKVWIELMNKRMGAKLKYDGD